MTYSANDVTINCGQGGSFTVNDKPYLGPLIVSSGDGLVIKLIPNSGYAAAMPEVKGTGVTHVFSNNTLTLKNITENVVVTLTFTYVGSGNSGGGGGTTQCPWICRCGCKGPVCTCKHNNCVHVPIGGPPKTGDQSTLTVAMLVVTAALVIICTADTSNKKRSITK